MTGEQAAALLDEHIQSDVLKKHCIATEAIMRALAERFGEDPGTWGIAGLLHDIDFEYTKDTPTEHGVKAMDLLAGSGLSEDVMQAIARHNAEMLNLERQTRLDFALTCAETITGLIVAAALVHPDKKIASLKTKSIRKRMKSKDFARAVSREHIALCEQIEIPLDDFIDLSLRAMESVHEQLGL